jgi:hypothetical protein
MAKKMEKYDLVAPCGDYCGGCGQYNRLIVETAKLITFLKERVVGKYYSTGV